MELTQDFLEEELRGMMQQKEQFQNAFHKADGAVQMLQQLKQRLLAEEPEEEPEAGTPVEASEMEPGPALAKAEEGPDAEAEAD